MNHDESRIMIHRSFEQVTRVEDSDEERFGILYYRTENIPLFSFLLHPYTTFFELKITGVIYDTSQWDR